MPKGQLCRSKFFSEIWIPGEPVTVYFARQYCVAVWGANKECLIGDMVRGETQFVRDGIVRTGEGWNKTVDEGWQVRNWVTVGEAW